MKYFSLSWKQLLFIVLLEFKKASSENYDNYEQYAHLS